MSIKLIRITTFIIAIIIVGIFAIILFPNQSKNISDSNDTIKTVGNLRDLMNKYGTPEATMYSTYFGDPTVYYVYPEKGIALIVDHPESQIVFEIWEFESQSLDSFKEYYKDTVQDSLNEKEVNTNKSSIIDDLETKPF